MKKIYCVIWHSYRKLKNPKTYIFRKISIFCIIYSKRENEDDRIFKKEE